MRRQRSFGEQIRCCSRCISCRANHRRYQHPDWLHRRRLWFRSRDVRDIRVPGPCANQLSARLLRYASRYGSRLCRVRQPGPTRRSVRSKQSKPPGSGACHRHRSISCAFLGSSAGDGDHACGQCHRNSNAEISRGSRPAVYPSCRISHEQDPKLRVCDHEHLQHVCGNDTAIRRWDRSCLQSARHWWQSASARAPAQVSVGWATQCNPYASHEQGRLHGAKTLICGGGGLSQTATMKAQHPSCRVVVPRAPRGMQTFSQ